MDLEQTYQCREKVSLTYIFWINLIDEMKKSQPKDTADVVGRGGGGGNAI
jgi:hypothetical protein